MSQRICGTCTACCEGWLVSEVTGMKPGTPCQHCRAEGCAIYEKRPVDPCVNFDCGWLKDEKRVPVEMRPDRCGAIVLFDRHWNDWKVIKAFPTGEAIPEKTLEWLMDCVRETGMPMIFYRNTKDADGRFSGMRQFGFGPPAFIEAVRSQIDPDVDVFRN